MKRDGDGCLAVIVIAVAVLALLVAVSAALGALFWLLWSAAIVPAFGAPELSYWHAWGIWAAVSLVAGLFRARLTVRGER